MAMAAPLTQPLARRLAWPLAAACAFVFLVGLALHGERPDSMAQFKPAGLLTAFAPEDVRTIDIESPAGARHFRREDGKWNASSAVAERIEVGLRLLRNSGPLRVLSADEVARIPPAEYALSANSLHVSVRAANGAVFAIRFGGLNPLGAANYVAVDGMAGVPLLPAHVAEAWKQLAGDPP